MGCFSADPPIQDSANPPPHFRPMVAARILSGRPATELTDSFGRAHRSLRISVTDRCNLRCVYCMPAGEIDFAPRDQLLTFEEIARVVGILAGMGIREVRLTGGEPLVRRDLDRLIELLAAVEGVTDLALTTNGMLLPGLARSLRQAGLRRLNISLDTLNEARFQQLTRRTGVQRVLDGIDAAIEAGFEQIRLNALAIRGWTEVELISLIEFAAPRGLTLRFIEYMPLDAERGWQLEKVLSGDDILARIRRHFGELRPVPPPQPSQPARDYELIEWPASPDQPPPRVGLIRPVTEPFCGQCDRLRLTAEGTIRNCLFSHEEWDLREPLRRGASDEEILGRIVAAVDAKAAGHLISQSGFAQPARAMFQIGG